MIVPTERGRFGADARNAILVALLAMLVIAVYHATFGTMAQLWSTSAYQHGYVVVPISLWLLWSERGPLGESSIRGSWLGLVAVAVLVIVWLASSRAAVQTLEHLTAVLMVPAFVFAVLGWSAFRPVAFPLLFLVFAAPVGDEITPWLVKATADVSDLLFKVFGVPALREGPYFTLEGGSFVIADVCSGFKNLTAGVFIAVLGGYMLFRSWWKRALFVVLTAISYVLVNGLRAFITMVVASATGGRILGGQDHVYFGWVIFGVLMLLVVWVGSRFADRKQGGVAAVASGVRSLPRTRTAIVIGILGATLLITGPLIRSVRAYSTVHVEAPALPTLAGCAGPDPWRLSWTPVVKGSDAHAAGSYACDGYDVHLYWAGFGNQQQGRELVTAGNHILPSGYGRVVRGQRVVFTASDGARIEANKALVDAQASDTVIWYWYEVDGVPVRNPGEVKLREALGALDLKQGLSSVSLVAVSAIAADPTASSKALERSAWALRDANHLSSYAQQRD